MKENKQDQETSALVTTIAGIGMFVSTLDMGIVNVALPTLGHYFSSSVSTTALTVVSYGIGLAAFNLLFGAISDKVGRLNIAHSSAWPSSASAPCWRALLRPSYG